MNCPSRIDEALLLHPDWNQNPPFLAADLTTREDLNGRANERERDDGGDCIPPGCGGGELDAVRDTSARPPQLREQEAGVGRLSFGLATPRMKTAGGGAGHLCLPLSHARSGPVLPQNWSQVAVAWVLSLAISSALCFLLGSRWNSKLVQKGVWHSQAEQGAPVNSSLQTSTRRHHNKRAGSTCPTGDSVDESLYNTPLHVGALFIILTVSTLACSFPLLATRFPGLQLSQRFFFAVRHFGTGVLIATAFVHLLPTAFILLGDPCLASFWTVDYPAMPGAIALTGIFLVVVVEMVFHPCRRVGVVGGERSEERAGGVAGSELANSGGETETKTEPEAPPVPVRDMSPLGGRATSIGRSLSRIERQGTGDDEPDLILRADEQPTKHPRQLDAEAQSTNSNSNSSVAPDLTPEQKLRKDMLQCVLLEVGILFHSVFIGMALSVSIGTEFIILLIAIAFHQTFEGLALGSRISAIIWPSKNALQPWFMALAYGCTTPLGQALGLAIHTLYTPDSEIGLLLVGTMNALSAGLLTFASLVELLSEDLLSDESWSVLRGRKRVCACALVFAGAAAMSLVGAWA